MNIYPVAAAAASDSGQSNSVVSQSSNMFLQLLMAQLKSQSPIDPVDPTQFVEQLVQFNSLSQLVDIHSLLQQIAAGGSTSGSSPNQGAH